MLRGFREPLIETAIWFNASGSRLSFNNQASGAAFLNSTSGNITKVDLTDWTHAKLVCYVQTGSASANTPKVRCTYATAFGTPVIAEYSANLCTTELGFSLTNVGFQDTGYLPIATAARRVVYVTCEQSGGDITADPSIGMLALWLSRQTQ